MAEGRTRQPESGPLRSRATTTDPTSPAELEKAALRYLERRDASTEQLRRVLLRRAVQASAEERERVRQRIDELLARYQASRLIDDARYAESLVRTLRERGASSVRIRLKLRQRGIDEATTNRVLERLADDTQEAELTAARAYAHRRRLRARYELGDPAQRQKALAALARQGFSYGVCTAALAPEDSDDEGPF